MKKSKLRTSYVIRNASVILMIAATLLSGDPVVVSGGTANDYESWIIRTNDSRLMVVFCRNPDWESGDLYMTFSSDNGMTWEQPSAIIEKPLDQATLCFLQLSGDTLRLWYASNENITYGIYTAHSSDGSIWNEDGPIDLGWGPSDMHYDPTVIMESDSSLTMSYRGPGGSYIAHCPFGGTWDTLRTMVGPSGYRPRVMKHSNGTYLYAYHRNTTSGYEVFVRTSLDRVDWTPELRITFEGNSHDPFPTQTTDGGYMLYYATYSPPAYNLYRRVSYDGVNWEEEEQITFDATNNTQPHFFVEGDEIFLVWAHAVVFPNDHDVYFERTYYTGIAQARTAEEDIKENSFAIDPNPCSKDIRVTLPVSKRHAARLNIYDIQGRNVTIPPMPDRFDDRILIVPTADLPSGVYFLRVEWSGREHCKRFVVAH